MENEKCRSNASKKDSLKISEKKYITLNEACKYFNVGINRMRVLVKNSNAILIVASKKQLINREKFEAELEAMENRK